MSTSENGDSFVELNHVLGAILRDIAQARVSADVYSRDISRYYEQDSLLRLFPIPRTEINEVNIDLKFAISDMQADRSASVAGSGRIREKFSRQITAAIFDAIRKESTKSVVWSDFLASFESEQRLLLISEFIDIFETPDLQGSFMDPVLAMINTRVFLPLDGACSLDAQLATGGVFTKKKTVRASVKSAVQTSIDSVLRQLNVALDQGEEVFRVAVDVKAIELQKIPELAVSSLRITTSMRNYVWSQVDTKGEEVIRRLVPE